MSPLHWGVSSYTASFPKSLSALFNYEVTEFNIVQKRTNFSLLAGSKFVSSKVGSQASFKTTADTGVSPVGFLQCLLPGYLYAELW
jgi:hypothetical protein